MGGTITAFPNGFISTKTFGWSVVGGGTLNSAVADASDATYILDNTPGSANTRITWTIAPASLPAGAAVKYTYPVVRNSQAAGNGQLQMSVGTYNPPDNISYQSSGKVWTPVPTINDTVGLPAGSVPQSRSQGVANILILTVYSYPSNANIEDHRLYQVKAQVQYVDSPTVSAVGLYPPSANTLTTRPGVQWGFNSVDNFSQYEYRVALWKQTDVALFSGGRSAFEANANNPWLTSFVGTDSLTHTPIWVSNKTTGSSGWVQSSDTNVGPDVDLVNSTAYTYYVQVSALHSGERLYHPTSMGILDFTQSLTTPTVPTSVTPTWVGSPNYRGSISVVYPSQALGSWTGRQLIVQGRDSGSTSEADWKTLPTGTLEIGSTSGTAVLYDPLIAQGQSKTYRAKTLWYQTSTGYSAGSAWVTSSAITGVYNTFVLRDPYTAGSEVVAKLLGDLTSTQEEAQGAFRPLGLSYPVVISDALVGQRWNAEVMLKDKATEVALLALRKLQTPLVFHTDMADIWYWVRIGPNVTRRIDRQSNRLTESTRTSNWQLELIQVGAPYGQPAGTF